MAEYYIAHHGVKGMKWGKRKKYDEQPSDNNQTANDPRAQRRRKAELVVKNYLGLADTLNTLSYETARANRRNKSPDFNTSINAISRASAKAKKRKTVEEGVADYMAMAGTIASIAKATAAYKKYADLIIDKVGDRVVKDIKFGNMTR